jgi:hypothetical protein
MNAEQAAAALRLRLATSRTCNACGGHMSGLELLEARHGMTVDEFRSTRRRGECWGYRTDAKFCSNACRQRAYRSRRKQSA